jgi:DNA repair protein RadC
MNTRTLKKHLKYKIPQIKLAILREPTSEPLPAIRTPDDLEQYLEPMKYMSEEHFIALHLNAKNQVMGYHVVSHGTLSALFIREKCSRLLCSITHIALSSLTTIQLDRPTQARKTWIQPVS